MNEELIRISRSVANQEDLIEALWHIVESARATLHVDRMGIFVYDRGMDTVQCLVGIDRNGLPEYLHEPGPVQAFGPTVERVIRRVVPYCLTDDAARDYPEHAWAPGVGPHATLPVCACGEILGLVAVDSYFTRRPILPAVLDGLVLYAALAALPLFALSQQRERERSEARRRNLYRELVAAVTNGKVVLCEPDELDRLWQCRGASYPILKKPDIREIRNAVRAQAESHGYSANRVEDFCLCISEAATNALIHGSGGEANIACVPDRMQVRIADQGSGISPDDLPYATLVRGWSKRASLGLGFTLIYELADQVYLSTGSQGTTLLLELRRSPDPSPSPREDLTLDSQ